MAKCWFIPRTVLADSVKLPSYGEGEDVAARLHEARVNLMEKMQRDVKIVHGIPKAIYNKGGVVAEYRFNLTQPQDGEKAEIHVVADIGGFLGIQPSKLAAAWNAMDPNYEDPAIPF